MINTKRIAYISDSRLYLGEGVKDKIMSFAKVKKNRKSNVDFYTVEEIKGKEDHKKFITEFIKRLERK